MNWRNPAARQAQLDVVRFWLRAAQTASVWMCSTPISRMRTFGIILPRVGGFCGFDRQKHIHDISQPEMYPLLREIRSILDERPETYVVGETFMGDEKLAASYCAPCLLHQAFDFRLLESKWDARRFQQVIQSWENALLGGSWPNYVLGNHDTRRPATRLGRGENDERLKVINAMLFTLRKTPFLYYGDEIGMRDISLARNELQDPVGVRYWPLPVGRDGCRSPMQWKPRRSLQGSTTSTPWLKIHPNYELRNLAAQKSDPDSLYNFTRKLIHLRRENEALRRGMYMPLIYYPRSLMIYLRKTEGQSVLVALNFTRRRIPFVFGHGLALREWELLLSNRRAEITLSGGGYADTRTGRGCAVTDEIKKNNSLPNLMK